MNRRWGIVANPLDGEVTPERFLFYGGTEG